MQSEKSGQHVDIWGSLAYKLMKFTSDFAVEWAVGRKERFELGLTCDSTAKKDQAKMAAVREGSKHCHVYCISLQTVLVAKWNMVVCMCGFLVVTQQPGVNICMF